MSEPEQPMMRFHMDGEDYGATPENTALFTFIGRLASRDHIFVQTEQEGHQAIGIYIFKFALAEAYGEMQEYMLANGYTCHLNMRQVAECDENAYANCTGNIAERELASMDSELDKLLGTGDGSAAP